MKQIFDTMTITDLYLSIIITCQWLGPHFLDLFLQQYVNNVLYRFRKSHAEEAWPIRPFRSRPLNTINRSTAPPLTDQPTSHSTDLIHIMISLAQTVAFQPAECLLIQTLIARLSLTFHLVPMFHNRVLTGHQIVVLTVIMTIIQLTATTNCLHPMKA